MTTLLVTRIGPGASVQDLGRAGYMHEGVPPGGALAPALLRLANASLGNAPADAGLELPLHGASFVADAHLTVSLDGVLHHLVAGEELRVDPAAHAVRYLAVPGGFDVPRVLGGRGTLPVAGLGGVGRFLRKGDRLEVCGTAGEARGNAGSLTVEAGALRVVTGPDELGAEALDMLFTTTFTVSKLGDRTGLRLEGGKLPVPGLDRRYSTPMVRGAMQVTTDGSLIVLGPDHPTTGGYPVICILHSEDVGRLALRRPGEDVTFERYELSVP